MTGAGLGQKIGNSDNGASQYQGYFDLSLGRNFPLLGVGVTGGQYWIADPTKPDGNIKGTGAEPGIDVAPGARIEAGINAPGNDPVNWIINQ